MNQDQGTIITATRTLYNGDRSAKAFFDAAASRKLEVSETSIDRMIEMAKSDRLNTVTLGRALEKAGLGKLVIGRSGHKTRFQWHYSLPTIGKVASGNAEALVELPPNAEPSKETPIPRAMLKSRQAQATEPPKKIWNFQKVKGQSAQQPQGRGTVALTIPEAKKQLAAALGVPLSSVEIVIKN